MPAQNGFYTGELNACMGVAEAIMTNEHGSSLDFELGLELDGAEVRGVLLYEERELSPVVFDMCCLDH
jgi:hypothetical protein